MSSSSSPLPLPLINASIPSLLKPLSLSPFPISNRSPPPFLTTTNSNARASLNSLNPSNSGPEESRWLREEQRWLREEQRWLREERRWSSERESLLIQISELKFKIQALERADSARGASVSETLAKLAAILQALKDAEGGSGAESMALEEAGKEEVEDVVVKEVVSVSGKGREEKMKKTISKKVTLRKGSEGEDVREMQEALQKLGFYSGEEDVEFSSFSSGTERAVKTWQATIGAPEDGIMTAELLERLFTGQQIMGLAVNAAPKEKDVIVLPKDSLNGAVTTSVTEISEKKQAVVQQGGVAEINESHHQVFLLGENRWEEPSRLTGRDKQNGGGRSKTGEATTKCLVCRGEGRLLCMECDGTGEPNIEPQFLEWVDEEMKCPYCGGVGYTICDVCEGKK